MRQRYIAYLGDLTCSASERYQRDKGKTKTDEKMREESDSLIVPMKPLIAAEGRGGDTDRSERQNIKHTGCEMKWKMRMTE